MKRIYTVTFHDANNYGAVIQAYALQKILSKKYDTKILDYKCSEISKSYKLFRKSNNGIKENLISFAKSILNLKKDYLRNKHFSSFKEKLMLSDTFYTSEDVKNNYPSADAYITGSDQVWNPTMTGGLDPVYTLDFGTGDFKKISYAASAGNNNSFADCQNVLIKCVKNFDKVSVRELPLKEFITSNITKDVELVLDPSLLIHREEWEDLCKQEKKLKNKYILVYCGDEPDYFYDIVNELARKTGYLIIHFGRRDIKNKFKYKKKSFYECGPEMFVSLIKNAEYVVTASFHGTALATIFNKKMFIVLNKYSDRLKTLLDSVELSDRILYGFDDFERVFKNETNWNRTNDLLEKERQKSINWLINSIEEN